MTTPASIVVSLEMAKALARAGWDQKKSHFWFSSSYNREKGRHHCVISSRGELTKRNRYIARENFAAPTAEELLRKLPVSLSECRDDDLIILRNAIITEWCIAYERRKSGHLHGKFIYDTRNLSLADAAASMWVYLKEHNLLPPLP